ncbi:DUF1330 domain-containing protein [Vibrio sp. ZSDZ34]|uniref:DUF1330 domain-containing protein n=1 Tax=Vibrio gelatinilyticus TaxID=2893468 RepID=A0A9X1W9N1_9VIBR|nr:DUF1330 domain-containing protein [Vibrio gelatinilyticus]MCJ2376852.1 DUF1330 domain-containing protein [Vibrio gelatinilyticus]
MTQVPVYMVVNLSITDPQEYRHYEKNFFGLLKKHKGSFITYDDQATTLEGESPREGRMILFSFPCEDAAKGWWADPEYQAISEFRRNGTKMEFLTMLKGQLPRN